MPGIEADAGRAISLPDLPLPARTIALAGNRSLPQSRRSRQLPAAHRREVARQPVGEPRIAGNCCSNR